MATLVLVANFSRVDRVWVEDALRPTWAGVKLQFVLTTEGGVRLYRIAYEGKENGNIHSS